MDDELQTTNALLEAWPALTPEERLEAFGSIPRAEIDDFFLELQPRDQAALILALPVRERRIWMRLLAPDDATDVIQEVPEEDGGAVQPLWLGERDPHGVGGVIVKREPRIDVGEQEPIGEDPGVPGQAAAQESDGERRQLPGEQGRPPAEKGDDAHGEADEVQHEDVRDQ